MGQIRRIQRVSRIAQYAIITLIAGFAIMLPCKSLMAAELGQRFAAHDPKSSQAIDHSAWDRLLKAYVSTDRQGLNRFDYAGMKAHG
ncbi:MAG: hypothetical protein ACTSP0_10315, partial [Alphaproteobacteria bacterium]